MSDLYFTTFDQVARRLSATGIDLRVDHSPSDAFDEANNAASLYVLTFLANRYPTAVLQTSGWVASVTADICIWYLEQWRNNAVSASVQARKEMWDEMLQMIMQNKMNVPDVTNGGERPEVIAQRVDNRVYPSLRTVRTGGTSYRPQGYVQYPDRTEPRTS